MAKLSNARHEVFANEYLIDLNGAQAAIRAGYSERAAKEQAARLLTNANIQERISELMRERSKRTEITQDRVLKELARIAFADPRSVMSWGPGGVVLVDSATLTDDQAAIVSEVSQTETASGGSIKLKTNDKLKALEMVGRHIGMFVDRKEITGKDGAPLSMPTRIEIVAAATHDDGED